LEGNGRFEFLIVVPGKLCERPLRSICDGRDSFRYDRWAPEGDIGELFSPILNPETKLAISLRLRGRPVVIQWLQDGVLALSRMDSSRLRA
jgi:hypothetical protein